MKSKIVAIALCLFIGSGISYAALRDGLVSGWSFDDGTAKDVVGNNDGTIEDQVAVVEGKVGQALSFDGQGGYVNLGDTSNFPNGASARTVAFWTLVRGQAGEMYFMSWGECLKGGGFFSPRIDAGNIGLMVNNSAGHLDINAGPPVTEIQGVWSHLVYTYDGATTVEIYLNGSLAHTGDIAAPLDVSTGHDAYIAARNCLGGANSGVDGSIDEILLWDRVLSGEEIASVVESGIPPADGTAVEPSGKLSILWGMIKSQTR